MDNLIQPLNDNLCQKRVSYFINGNGNGNGNWDRLVLQELLHAQLVEQIVSLPPPRIIESDYSCS